MYVRGHAIRLLERCGVSLLMGCSSGKLKTRGEFDPVGTPLNYMIAGCPCLVANLWDVTDKDIDRFGTRLLRESGIVADGEDRMRQSLPMAVACSRDACQLRFLVGAAPVVYGLPVWLE